VRQPGRRYALWLNVYFVAVFVGIGGLQMYRVDAGFLTNHGADLFAPPYLYLVTRGGAVEAGAAWCLRSGAGWMRPVGMAAAL